MECDAASCRDMVREVSGNFRSVCVERDGQNRWGRIHQRVCHRDGDADGADVRGVVLMVSVAVRAGRGGLIGDRRWRGKGMINVDVAERQSELESQREQRQHRQPFCV